MTLRDDIFNLQTQIIEDKIIITALAQKIGLTTDEVQKAREVINNAIKQNDIKYKKNFN